MGIPVKVLEPIPQADLHRLRAGLDRLWSFSMWTYPAVAVGVILSLAAVGFFLWLARGEDELWGWPLLGWLLMLGVWLVYDLVYYAAIVRLKRAQERAARVIAQAPPGMLPCPTCGRFEAATPTDNPCCLASGPTARIEAWRNMLGRSAARVNFPSAPVPDTHPGGSPIFPGTVDLPKDFARHVRLLRATSGGRGMFLTAVGFVIVVLAGQLIEWVGWISDAWPILTIVVAFGITYGAASLCMQVNARRRKKLARDLQAANWASCTRCSHPIITQGEEVLCPECGLRLAIATHRQRWRHFLEVTPKPVP